MRIDNTIRVCLCERVLCLDVEGGSRTVRDFLCPDRVRTKVIDSAGFKKAFLPIS